MRWCRAIIASRLSSHMASELGLRGVVVLACRRRNARRGAIGATGHGLSNHRNKSGRSELNTYTLWRTEVVY
jgi:hypothetical protein